MLILVPLYQSTLPPLFFTLFCSLSLKQSSSAFLPILQRSSPITSPHPRLSNSIYLVFLPPPRLSSIPFYHRMARGSSQERKNISNNTSRSSNHIISVLNSPVTSASPSPEPYLVSSSTMVGRKNTMRRSPQAEVTLPVTYTPTTHRISKAKKGKRVHACEYPGCNKVCAR